MPRPARFSVKKGADGYWRVNVPAKYSETGKRCRPTFRTRDAANKHAAGLRESVGNYGASSSVLRPAQAEDAHLALQELDGLGASLLDVARFYREAKERDSASLPLGEAARKWLAGCTLRPTTYASYEATVRVLGPLGDKLLSALGPSAIEDALREGSGKSYKLHYGNAFTFWRWAARKGWCDKETFERVEKPARQSAKPIVILTAGQAKKLLRMAEEHDPEIAGAYAVLLYSGIREAEAARMTWGDFTEDGLRIASEASKLHTARFIPWTDTLKAWVDQYRGDPAAPILPPNWTTKDNQMRGRAGWSVYNKADKENPNPEGPAWPRNALRKTHAAMAVAMGTPIEQLTFTFGHGTGLETLRRHYAGAMTKRDALKLAQFGPRGTKVVTTKAA